MSERSRILLIDDDAVDRASVRRALKSSGIPHDLVEAADGASGLQAARSQTFDCVLLDYRLPDAEAIDILEALVSPDGGRQAVVMLTGEADQNVAVRTMEAGALDYLSKSETSPSSLSRAIRYAKARRTFLAELENARLDAEEKSNALDILNRQKTLLLSIIAHDLRNPFQALLGLSSMLGLAVQSGDLDLVVRRAQGLHEAASQAFALAESLFGWASLQMDAAALDVVDVDVGEIAAQSAEEVAQAAESKGIAIRNACDGRRARAHPEMLAAVLRNLLSNAVKFSHLGGEVRISSRSLAGDVLLEVVDQGLGIEPAKMASLFDFHRRSTSVGTAGERGGGLGLLLCRDMVERMGGLLSVESEVGRGTSFTVRLKGAA